MSNPAPVVGDSKGKPSGAISTFFGSASFTFAAFMDVLKARQEIMTTNAKLAEATAKDQKDYIDALATYTQNSYQDDADQTIAQRNQQIVQGCESLCQAGVTAGSVVASRSASKYSANMDDLVKQTNEFSKEPLPSREVGHLHDLTPEETARQKTIEEITTEIKTKGFDYKKGIFEGETENNKGLNKEIRNGVTLKDVLQKAKKDGNLEELRGKIGSERKHAAKQIMQEQQNIQWKTQFAEALTRAAGTIPGGIFKTIESGTQVKKGKDSALQQVAQYCGQTAKDVGDAERQAAEQSNQASQQLWQQINQVVQVDTRG